MDVRSLIEALLQHDLNDDVEIRMRREYGSDVTGVENINKIGNTVYIEIDLKGYDL